jgi:hypothetical protein
VNASGEFSVSRMTSPSEDEVSVTILLERSCMMLICCQATVARESVGHDRYKLKVVADEEWVSRNVAAK